jgi:hypothetical protein
MGTIIDTADISLGIGVMEFGNYDESLVFGGYDYVGAIKGTWSMAVTRETRDFETGQPLVVVIRQVLRERVEISFQMAEWRTANWKFAFGGGVVTDSVIPAVFLDGSNAAPKGDLTDSVVGVGLSDVFSLGGQCDLNRVGLRFTHLKSCTTGKRQIVEVWFAQAMGQVTLPFNEEDWNLYTVQFIALADTTKSAGSQYVRIIDER